MANSVWECIVFQNMLITIYYRAIYNHNWKLILFGTKLLSVQFMFKLRLTPWNSEIVIIIFLLISPDDSLHCSSCPFGYCSTVRAGLKTRRWEHLAYRKIYLANSGKEFKKKLGQMSLTQCSWPQNIYGLPSQTPNVLGICIIFGKNNSVAEDRQRQVCLAVAAFSWY